MASIWLWAFGATALALVAIYYGFSGQQPVPPQMTDGWFGAGPKPKPDNEAVRKFTVDIKNPVLQDLKQRLENSRISEDLEESTFEYGIQSSVLRSVLLYWKDKYDWKKHEKTLNSFDQYKTQIEGIMVYFIHAKSKHKTGFDAVAAARVYHKLMNRIGHQRYYIQGGDWGSIIGSIIAAAYPKEVIGIHLNMFPPAVNSMRAVILQMLCPLWPTLFVNENEAWKCRPQKEYWQLFLQESGYFHIQATKPDTIGVGLNDSPIGLAAYLMEKFAPYTDVEKVDGNLFKSFTMDELITNVMIYWVNGNIKSAVRLYKEYFRGDAPSKTGWDLVPIKVPTGLAAFPGEFLVMPKLFVTDKYQNIIQYNDMPRGGHFAALEEPKLLAEDLRSFVVKVEAIIHH